MKGGVPLCRVSFCVFIMMTALLLVIFSTGCTTQPAAAPSAGSTITATTAVAKSAVVTADQPDNTTIIVTYQGGPDLENLMELEITVTDSRGISKTRSMGTRQDTTPVQRLGTTKFTGNFQGRDHVVVTGYFSNGTVQNLLDTLI